MDQRFIDLYDEYTHRPLSRRVFLERLTALAGSSAAAAALLPLLDVRRAAAAQVEPADPRLKTERASYPGKSGAVSGYLARPAAEDGRRPGVLVIHENRGLNAHIEDVARRLALAGYLAFAPDALSPTGGTPEDSDEARARIGALDLAQTVEDFVAATGFLARRAECNGRVASLGFCWGGGMSAQLAFRSPDLSACVVFYGRPPDPGDVARIRVPLLLHYAALDERLNALLPDFEAALARAGTLHTLYRYAGAQHAFHNDTAPSRYDADAAKLAWERTLAFLATSLGAPEA